FLAIRSWTWSTVSSPKPSFFASACRLQAMSATPRPSIAIRVLCNVETSVDGSRTAALNLHSSASLVHANVQNAGSVVEFAALRGVACLLVEGPGTHLRGQRQP